MISNESTYDGVPKEDARETHLRAARNGEQGGVAGKLLGLLVVSLTDPRSALPVPLGDRRSSNLGDSTARRLPEMPPERPETASEPGAEAAGT